MLQKKKAKQKKEEKNKSEIDRKGPVDNSLGNSPYREIYRDRDGERYEINYAFLMAEK